MLLWAGFLSISFSLFLVTVAVHAQEDGTELRHYVVNLTGTRSPFRSGMWGTIMGSGHAALGLRSDWQKQLATAAKELGVRAVRFHGILDDDMGVVVQGGGFNFEKVDAVIDAVIAARVRPYVELSFMPLALASSNATSMHYKALISPPKNYTEWGKLVQALVSHFAERYGAVEVSEWRFEVWNEPNLKGLRLGSEYIGQFWTGTQADYFELYRHTATAVKAVNESFSVGGPASSGGVWLAEIVSFCKKEGLPLDFLSTHGYPTEVNHGRDPDGMLTLAKAAAERVPVQFKGDLIVSEFNSGLFQDPFFHNHDSSFAAAFLASQMPQIASGVARISQLSYWTFSDIFEEVSFRNSSFHNGYGVQTVHGIPKPAYRSLQLLRRLSNASIPISQPVDDCNTTKCSLAISATVRDGGENTQYQILISNFGGRRLLPNAVEVNLTFIGLRDESKITVTRIDEENANAYTRWQKMGKPESLSQTQKQELISASELVPAPLSAGLLHMPANSVALVEIA